MLDPDFALSRLLFLLDKKRGFVTGPYDGGLSSGHAQAGATAALTVASDLFGNVESDTGL